MKRFIRFSVAYLFLAGLFSILAESIHAQDDPFKATVRPTEHLTPEQELAAFKLPPGFEMQLFASEPEIAKPMNMAFDDRGRMWITNTVEYPFAAPPDRPGRDSIKILEDTDGDGRADKVSTFADELNIPIGILPIESGCIAFSIPNIWKLEDTDGDGKCDRRTVLYGPFGYERDTHGMNNAFTLGLDGWVYACHGFNNVTNVQGADGHVVEMQSGNTYRFRLDGSRIEQYTCGQVNPFGMTMDERGNLFSSDCHTKPLYPLLQGGYYPSFGKPDDGLGFVPQMMEHLHDSTANDGACYYDDDRFPTEFRGNFFTGNVMTSRVNRDKITFHGSTMIASEQPDLVVTTDPWFRPADIKLGPDGAIYIGDFYNKVIGHYEVDLKHPGRDRTSGRIWRLVYKGTNTSPQPSLAEFSLAEASNSKLVAELKAANITRRLLAFQRIARLANGDDAEALIELLEKTFAASDSDQQRAFCVWALERGGRLDEEHLQKACRDVGPLTRLYAQQILSARSKWDSTHRLLAVKALLDADPFVRREAAEGLGLHADAANVLQLCAIINESKDDAMLRHAQRIALRNILQQTDAFKTLADKLNDKSVAPVIADVCEAIKTPASAEFLLGYLAETGDIAKQDPAKLAQVIRFAASNISHERLPNVVEIVRKRFADNVDFQAETLFAIREGMISRNEPVSDTIKAWGSDVARQLLASYQSDNSAWFHEPLAGRNFTGNPWNLQKSVSADGDKDSMFFCTLPSGEQATGVLRSAEFDIPGKLSFYCAGHIGFPGKPVFAENFVRLLDAKTGAVLKEATPPRNDTAQKIEWDLTQFAGKPGRFEIVDGDQDTAYAWLAVGRFDPPVVELPKTSPAQNAQRVEAAARIVADFRLENLRPQLQVMLGEKQLDFAASGQVASCLASFEDDVRFQAIARLAGEIETPKAIREALQAVIAHRREDKIAEVLSDSLQVLPVRLQLLVAESLASKQAGAKQLLELIGNGKASVELLRNERLRSQLQATADSEMKSQIAGIVAELPSINEQLLQRMNDYKLKFALAEKNVEAGKAVFEKNCANCHQIGQTGKMAGPQLDGVGNRGLERLLEDIFAPNQNVDVAFRSSVINTKDGVVLTGLFRRQEGDRLVFVDGKGNEFSVRKSDIDERFQTLLSLMPENWLDTLKENEVLDLIEFLTQQKKTPTQEQPLKESEN